MKREEIEELVSGYAVAVQKMDIKNIASHFHDRFILSTQTSEWIISKDDEFKSNLANSFDAYKKLGAQFCKKVAHDIIEFQSNHCLVNIEWGLFDDKSAMLVSFDISYCIKQMDKDFKFIFVVAHNEAERIERYLRSSDDPSPINTLSKY
jgi:hypothetical protein